MEELENWASVKEFKDKEVEKEKLERIFEQTTNAPTAFNLQPYRFIVLDSEDEKEKAVDAALPNNEWIGEADKIAVLVAFEELDRNSGKAIEDMINRDEIDLETAGKFREMFEDYKKRDDEFITGWLTRNTFIPATFFMIACRSEGIGSCPVRGFDKDKLTEKLNLGDERPMLLIPIGYPEEESRSWRRKEEKIFEVR